MSHSQVDPKYEAKKDVAEWEVSSFSSIADDNAVTYSIKYETHQAEPTDSRNCRLLAVQYFEKL